MSTSSTATPRPLSVLIVGCGNIAGGWDAGRQDDIVRTHAKAYQRHGGFRLAGCVDPDLDRRLAFQARWGVDASFSELAEVAERAYDVVSICSPAEMHAVHLRQALAMDVGLVFCEKPLTSNISSSRQMVAAYAARRRPLAVNYIRRWDSEVQALKAEIESGAWGRLLAARGLYTKGIFANGSHLVDLLHFLFGPLAPVSVSDLVDDSLPDDPTLSASLRTPAGALVTLTAGDRRCYTVFELDLLFEKGRVSFAESGFKVCRRRVVDDARFDGYRVLEPAEWRDTGLDSAILAAVGNIHAALAGDAPLASTGETALLAHETCAALVRMAGGATTEGMTL